MAHVYFKESIEVLRSVVSENRRDCADLRRWEYRQQGTSKRKADINLALATAAAVAALTRAGDEIGPGYGLSPPPVS